MRRETLRVCAPACLLSAYPLAVVVGNNLEVVPLRVGVLARALAVALILTALCLWALRPLWRDLPARAAWLGWVFLLFGLYGYANTALQEQFWFPNRANAPGFAIPYAVASAAIASVIVRPWETRRRGARILALLSVALVLGALAPAVQGVLRGRGAQWRGPADAIIESALASPAAPRGPARDIYYIVVDGFGSAGTLRRLYAADLGPFVTALQSRHFQVAEHAQSNYAQTYLSLASTLNMNYLDEVASEMGSLNRDRRPLEYLIQRNALMTLASRAGYQVVGIGSDYMATERLDGADVCVCDQYGLDEIEMGAIALTPFAALPLDRWTYGAHRRKVVDAFTELKKAAALPGPKLVFAHIVAPHPPFVFGGDGSPRRPAAEILFAFSDANHFRDTRARYITGYREQVEFVTRNLLDVIDELQRRAGPAPAIVVHGDHGPGSSLHWERPDPRALPERMDIFAAYSFPETGPLSARITPVNGARALVTRYLGVSLPLLPDRSFFSRWSRPYEFIPYAPAS